MARVFQSPHQLKAAEGSELGSSDWLLIEQERINLFAAATGDHQWIHVDPERAATGPFHACIAHGYLTLSLVRIGIISGPRPMPHHDFSCLIRYLTETRVTFAPFAPLGVTSRSL